MHNEPRFSQRSVTVIATALSLPQFEQERRTVTERLANVANNDTEIEKISRESGVNSHDLKNAARYFQATASNFNAQEFTRHERALRVLFDTPELRWDSITNRIQQLDENTIKQLAQRSNINVDEFRSEIQQIAQREPTGPRK